MTFRPVGPSLHKINTGLVLALYPGDPNYDFEIQRAPDVAGAPGVFATIAAGVSGSTEVYADPLPLDNAQRWYRYRHTGFGDTPSAWVGPMAVTPSTMPLYVVRPGAVPASITLATAETSILGTLALTIADPQFRIALVEARTVVAGGAPSAWGTIAPAGNVYTQTVTITPGAAASSIEYRVTGYDVDGVSRIIAGELYTFGGVVGPSLNVTPTAGSSSVSIAYTPASGVQLSINGGAYSAAGVSPIVVPRPAAGSADIEYTFKLTANGQTVTDGVTITSLDKDTATPDLILAAGGTSNTVVSLTPAATNPAGGGSPTITMTLKGCTASSAGPVFYADGSVTVVASGTIISVNRPVFSTGLAVQASVTFRASISGGGAESISRTILNQVSLGPSLEVTPTPGPSSYSLAYTNTGTVTLSIDGGAYSAPGVSPIVVPRTSTDHVYSFKCVLDGQTMQQSVTIPATGGGSGGSSFAAVTIGLDSYAGDSIYVDWTPVGAPGGATYNVTVFEQTALANPKIGTTQTFIGASGGPYFISTINDIDAAGSRTKKFTAFVEMVSGSTVVATSTTVGMTLPSNT